MSDPREPWLRLQITPEPTPDERDALIAALTAYLAARPEGAPVGASSSRWATIGRQVAVRPLANRQRMGWGRDRAGWS